jgi:hypothetical protein
MTRAPIPGHISSLRAAEQEQKRTDTLKDASKKHIDPFTGECREMQQSMTWSSGKKIIVIIVMTEPSSLFFLTIVISNHRRTFFLLSRHTSGIKL